MTKLKYLFPLIAFALAPFSSLRAQDEYSDQNLPQHEISVGYGTITDIQIIDVFSDIIVAGVTLGSVSTQNKEFSGAIDLQYLYRPLRWLSYGLDLTYESRKQDCISRSIKTDEETKMGEQTTRYISLTPAVRFSWLAKDRVNMYSKLAFGMTFIADSYKKVSGEFDDTTVESEESRLFAYQVTPIGISVGTRIRGFAEMGFGRQGMFRFGLAYRFN